MDQEVTQHSDSGRTDEVREVAESGSFGRRIAVVFSTESGRRWAELGAYTALVVTAAVMRLWDLGSRAMHHDESLHAYFSWELAQGSGYEHNPMMHGPFQFEATSAVFFVLGDSEFTARLLYAVAGTILVAVPYFFRSRLGRIGALVAALLLTFSPAMLYFSRFARNDVLMAVWTLGLVICMWRYLDEGKNRYLYITAALVALSFGTKETAYIVTGVLGLYLVLVVLAQNLRSMVSAVRIGETTTPSAVGQVVEGLWSALVRGVTRSARSRAAVFLTLLVALTLPQWSALSSVVLDPLLESWPNIALANPTGADIGSPSGGGIAIAGMVVIVTLLASFAIGAYWNWSVWWRSAVIFYALWALMYSTFFTNISGIGSGMWQSLGYWLAQQDVARGGQPWYYYFVITSLYEFLPLLFAIIAGVYYWRRKDPFGRFLTFWAIVTLIVYVAAAEKMPWLLVNLTLPLIILSAKLLGDIVSQLRRRDVWSSDGLLVMAGVPLFLVLLWNLAFFGVGEEATDAPWALALLLVLVAAMVGLGVQVTRRIRPAAIARLAAIPVAVTLLVLGIRTGWQATYDNGDTPVEMLVYTQTSPQIAELARYIDSVEGSVPVTVDGTSGFQWPWAWYLRNNNSVGYPTYESSSNTEGVTTSVLLVHERNRLPTASPTSDGYGEGIRLKHRWWFPEQTYRGLTFGKFFKGFGDRDTWRNAMDYFLYRNVGAPLGSEDAFVYFSSSFPADFSPTP